MAPTVDKIFKMYNIFRKIKRKLFDGIKKKIEFNKIITCSQVSFRMILCLWKQIGNMFFVFGNSYVVDISPRCKCMDFFLKDLKQLQVNNSWQQKTGGRGKKALTWSVIKRISFKIKPNSYSVDDLMHVWCVTASGIRVLPIGPMLPSSPCLERGWENGWVYW